MLDGATFIYMAVAEALQYTHTEDEFNQLKDLIESLVKNYNADVSIPCFGKTVLSLLSEAQNSNYQSPKKRARQLQSVFGTKQTRTQPKKKRKNLTSTHDPIVKAQSHDEDTQTYSVLASPLFWGLCTVGGIGIGLGILYLVNKKIVDNSV